MIEETPAPNLPDGMAQALCSAAIALGKAVNYRSAGTVEFVYDSAAQRFYFLEVNTRLQVEHGVTEQVWGVDLVHWMIALAAGDLPPLSELAAGLQPRGNAIQARIYAEDPGRQFQPSPGLLTDVWFPPADGATLRIDRWVEAGCEVPPFFDPLLAKAIVWRPSRDEAIAGLAQALAETRLYGVETNRQYLQQILSFAPFTAGEPWTRCLEQLRYRADTVEVLSAGTQTSVQDYPGRLGYWAVGVPPSGPMDDRALRLGNRLLGNAEGDAALEITLSGPTLKFNTAVQAVVCGAPLAVTLDGVDQEMDCVFTIPAGATLRLGAISGPGVRSYLCLRGGIQVPDYLGSKSTFTLGQFGGHGGRALRAGDVLHLAPPAETTESAALTAGLRTELAAVRTLRVIYGPHGAPEFFAPAYMATFFATDWEVHFNSSRTGVRLIGPKPVWARDSGGEAGLHPSNIHDNPYAVGAVDFTGDMPVILGPDGPSLGGFVCPVTVIEADLWQLGQLKAGDKVRFVAVDVPTARRLAAGRRAELATLQAQDVAWQPVPLTSPVVMTCGDADKRLVARLSGDTHLLLEAGEAELDLVLRFRIHALMQALEEQAREGIIDITPGIRSLQLHFQPETLALETLLAWVREEWATVCMSDDLQVPTRVVHLPLSWDDPACRKAIDKYMTTVRPDAPWCPSNLEFIRRINDLPDEQAVWQTVFDASYLVMGLGDVYLGAPVATPLIRAIGWSPPSTTRREPGRRKTRWASAERICAFTAWKARAAISLSAAPCRCGVAITRWLILLASPGCCAFSTSCVSIRSRRRNCWRFAAISRSDATRCASSTARCGWRSTSSFSLARRRALAHFATISSGRLTTSASAGSPAARPISTVRRARQKRRAMRRCSRGNRGWKARYPAICGRCRPRPAARYAPAMCWWCLSR